MSNRLFYPVKRGKARRARYAGCFLFAVGSGTKLAAGNPGFYESTTSRAIDQGSKGKTDGRLVYPRLPSCGFALDDLACTRVACGDSPAACTEVCALACV